jgi:hypothetical protein
VTRPNPFAPKISPFLQEGLFTEAGLQPIGITITGGTTWHQESWHQWHVSKIVLVGTVQKWLQSGRLRIGATLPHASTFQRELRDFRVKISKAAHETYDAREGSHDDLVLALAIALFAANTLQSGDSGVTI